ncbi:hypothetical protein ANCCEY_12270 [Ancylostoma ceylanicum]|uniref:Phlebovirus glycoprotein G2 fusion domain-containing protein n=1 Tax=Ancylostoma ceylanicum TaxID=53326 RepID=A0A0D6LFC3_9BILA|nr:hypothetical protein ANCCEY_12270 [Ancylostoma ceylanicum]
MFAKEVEIRLPARRSWVTFQPDDIDTTTVSATIPSFTTAKILVHFKGKFDKKVTKTTDSVCKIENAILRGSYNCSQAARANISCTILGKDTMTTIQCDHQYFTVPCSCEGAPSTLLLRFTTARVRQMCDVSCGSNSTTFELTGILQWTRTIQGSPLRVIKGESAVAIDKKSGSSTPSVDVDKTMN